MSAPQAPLFDTRNSDALYQLATEYQNQVPAPIEQPRGPNLQEIGIALLPALLGQNPSYLGGVAGGYGQARNAEIGRREALRAGEMASNRANAQSLSTLAGQERSKELAQFSHESQNFRNEQDNQRIMAENAENRRIAGEKYQSESYEKAVQHIRDMVHDHTTSFGSFDSDVQGQVIEAIKETAKAFGKDPNEIKRKLLLPQADQKTLTNQKAEATKASQASAATDRSTKNALESAEPFGRVQGQT
jgi:hypothetical protein